MSQFTSILTTDDFKSGETRISQNQFEKETLKNYIAEIQEDYLKKLLGAELYLEFGAQLPTPTLQKFTDLLNGVVYTDHLDKKVDYTGLKRMLKFFTFYAYTNDQDVQNTIIGNVSGQSRNSNVLGPNSTLSFSEAFYNKGIDFFKESREFIQENDKQERTSTNVIDNLDGSYTVSVGSTLYMVAGEKFTINGAEYVFDSVNPDVSFDFQAVTGLNFPVESEIKYEIFTTFNGTEQNKSFFGGAIF